MSSPYSKKMGSPPRVRVQSHQDPCPYSLLVNAKEFKNAPGRKSDVRDCQWLAQLLKHGLLHGSFIPPVEIRELRDLTRGRRQLVGERTAVVNRVHKVLQDANVKLSSVASDIMGVSGRAMLDAIIDGESDPVKLAGMARGRLQVKSSATTNGNHWLPAALGEVAWAASRTKGTSTWLPATGGWSCAVARSAPSSPSVARSSPSPTSSSSVRRTTENSARITTNSNEPCT